MKIGRINGINQSSQPSQSSSSALPDADESKDETKG